MLIPGIQIKRQNKILLPNPSDLHWTLLEMPTQDSTNVQTAGPDNGCKTMKYEEEAKQFEKSLVVDQKMK